jgi:hypothetical protein
MGMAMLRAWFSVIRELVDVGIGVGDGDRVGVGSIVGFVELLTFVSISIGFTVEDEKRKVEETTKRDTDKTAIARPIAIGAE